MYSVLYLVPTREGKVPDPTKDKIASLFFAFQLSEEVPLQTGIFVLQGTSFEQRRIRERKIDVVGDEIELINKVVDIVVELDPDILVGWDIQSASWGYLDARARQHGILSSTSFFH
jgi:DNA polymerase zeta